MRSLSIKLDIKY